MAVQKSRKTPSKRDMRRSHDALGSATLSVEPTTGETHRRHHVSADGALGSATLSVEPTTGETHRRHHVSADGYYKGRKVIADKVIEDDDE